MKKTLLLSFLLAGSLISRCFAQAELQVIHNCADPAAEIVDIYLDSNLVIDDFSFRTATPFLAVPSGPVVVGIAPGTSTSVSDTLVSFPVNLMMNERYVIIASGVLNPASFSVNPDGRPTGFQLIISSGIQDAAGDPSEIDFKILHGCTDAPTVDVNVQTGGTLANDAAYTDFTGYITVPADDYILDLTPGNASTVIASYAAQLSGVGGSSAVVFASGFLDPAANQNGPAFGLFAALADGSVVEFPQVGTARLQVIHNAADPSADVVDVYLNGNMLIDDFEFRSASPFVDITSGLTQNIGIAPGNSLSASDTLVNIPVFLNNGETYVAIATGVLNPGAFASNPEGISTAFQLLLAPGMRESANDSTAVEFAVHHGSTDAPAVDITARNVAQLADSATYTALTSYFSVPPAAYIVDIAPASGSPILVSYDVDLSPLNGFAAVVFASGFLDSTANQNGPAFGLFAAFPDGTVIPFSPTTSARLQAIHNCADPAADSVDIYINGQLAIDNFAFRTATPFLDVPTGVNVNIGVAPKNSTGIADTLTSFNLTFNNGDSYVAIASGVLNPGSFAVNPDGRATGFTLQLQNQAREAALNSAEVDFMVHHGSTDAPTVDVVAVGVGVIVDDAAYGDFTPYLSVPPGQYGVQITPGNNNSIVVAQFNADVTGLAGGAATVFASGFLTPAANQNGPAFGLFAALADGTVIPFQNVTGIGENSSSVIEAIYPVPATDLLFVQIAEDRSVASIQILDIAGKIVQSQVTTSTGNRITVDVSELSAGTYFMNVIGDNYISSRRFSVMK